jgi:hypothetical protein
MANIHVDKNHYIKNSNGPSKALINNTVSIEETFLIIVYFFKHQLTLKT